MHSMGMEVATEPTNPVPTKPPFSPVVTLVLFTIVNVLTYFDRGVLSSVLDILELPTQMDLNTVYQGLLGNGFMIGFVVASPVFAHLSHSYRPLRMIALGQGIWCVATAACGMAPNYGVLLAARMLTGVGEASFVCLAPPLIDKLAPSEKRSKQLAIFYTAIPVGLALGFGFASVWVGDRYDSQHDEDINKPSNRGAFGLMDKEWAWRSAFLVECALMLPFVFLFATRKGDYIFSDDDGEDEEEEQLQQQAAAVAEGDGVDHKQGGTGQDAFVGARTTRSSFGGRDPREVVLVDENLISESDVTATGERRKSVIAQERSLKLEVLALMRNPLYVCLVLGYAAQTFVTGGFAFYGKEYLTEQLNYEGGQAGVLFGLTTAAMGLIGTGFGGWFVDSLRAKQGQTSQLQQTPGDSVAAFDRGIVLTTTAVLVFSTLCWPAGVAAILLGNLHHSLFFVFLAVTEFFLFASLTPINNAIMWSVPFSLNPLALAVSVVGTHMLGDAASPVIMGVIRHRTNSWNLTMILATCWLVWSVLFFALAVLFALRRAKRHRVELDPAEVLIFADELESSESDNNSHSQPLLRK